MEERTLASRTAFEGKLLRLDVVDVELPDGRQSVREIVRHPGAVVVLCRRPDGQFVFVRQFRKPVEQIVLESVAGTLDPGEDPAACARREVTEETGYTVESLTPLGRLIPAPGYTDEILHAFYAVVAAEPGAQDPDDDEAVEVVAVTRAAFEARVRRGEIEDAKTLGVWTLWQMRMCDESVD